MVALSDDQGNGSTNSDGMVLVLIPALCLLRNLKPPHEVFVNFLGFWACCTVVKEVEHSALFWCSSGVGISTPPERNQGDSGRTAGTGSLILPSAR